MRLYAETSAVVAWLLDERAIVPVEAALAGAEVVVTSMLTVVEAEYAPTGPPWVWWLCRTRALTDRRG